MRGSVRLLPYDVYERRAVVSHLAHGQSASQRSRRVLDVGGRARLRARFMDCAVVAANVDGTGDVHYDGRTLPFEDDTFDLVTSIDTLEHLPRECRVAFVQECLRVARTCAIVAALYSGRQFAGSRPERWQCACAACGPMCDQWRCFTGWPFRQLLRTHQTVSIYN